jgi:hypothetical protein
MVLSLSILLRFLVLEKRFKLGIPEMLKIRRMWK